MAYRPLPSAGLKLVVSSLLYRELPLLTSAASPVLPVMLPENNCAVPPLPTVTVGLPLIRMLPPVLVSAAVLRPALRTTAEADVLVVVMFCDTVRLPVSVSTSTVPVLPMPLVLPTVPIVSAALL